MVNVQFEGAQLIGPTTTKFNTNQKKARQNYEIIDCDATLRDKTDLSD